MRIQDSIHKDDSFLLDVLDKAHKSQDKLNAIVTFYDVKQQLEEQKSNKELLLNRVPIALKDNISTKGVRTTASSRILDNYVPVFNATIVNKLKDAGAIFIAKTSMDELGMGGSNINAYTGPTNNPWDTSRITGGSSGGSAALVAEGIVPIAIGTDTGDSVRKPATYCGIVGLKPTYGRISRFGVIPYASSLDHVGIFSTNVLDAATTLEVISGRDDADMTSANHIVEAYSSLINSDIKGKKIGIIQNVCDAITNKTINAEFEALIIKLKDRGAIVESIVFDDKLMNALLPTYYTISNAEATANHSNLDGIRFGHREDGNNLEEIMINSRTKGFSSQVRKRFVIGSYSLFVENQEKIFKKAQRVRRLIVEELERKLLNCDVLIASAAGSTAPLTEDVLNHSTKATNIIADNHMLLANFSGYPSISVPTSNMDGLPIGINLIAKPFDEVTMFNIAKAIEEETKLEGQCVRECKV